MGSCGCEDILIVETVPDSFRAFTRGHFLSLQSAQRSAKKAKREGKEHIVIVHNRETAMYGESWYVGHVATEAMAAYAASNPSSVTVTQTEGVVKSTTIEAKETVEAVEETVEAVEEPRASLPYESFVIDSCAVAPFYELRRVPDEFQKCFRRAHDFGKIVNSRRGYDLLIQDVARQDQEVFYLAALDPKLYCRGVMRVHKGVRDGTQVDPAIVLQLAFAMGGKAGLVYHCHPTGEATVPSEADIHLTEGLRKAFEAAKMGFFDHIVMSSTGLVPEGQYYSFSDQAGYRVRADGTQTKA